MKTGLVGYTGFVGTNLRRSQTFDGQFNRANIDQLADADLDVLICAAAPAQMWQANNDPDADWENIAKMLGHLQKSNARHCVLISSIAVLDAYDGGYDETSAEFEATSAYGKHRRMLEASVAESFDVSYILRLPALFGHGLKKNFLFDILNPVPSFLKKPDYEMFIAGLSASDQNLVQAYFAPNTQTQAYDFDRSRCAHDNKTAAMNAIIQTANLAATRFTHKDTAFQYYNLENLKTDIDRAMQNDLTTLHLSAEPVQAAEIYQHLTGDVFDNIGGGYRREDMRSKHGKLWGQDSPYLYSKTQTLDALKVFFNANKAR